MKRSRKIRILRRHIYRVFGVGGRQHEKVRGGYVRSSKKFWPGPDADPDMCPSTFEELELPAFTDADLTIQDVLDRLGVEYNKAIAVEIKQVHALAEGS